jgi:hypothetical protein
MKLGQSNSLKICNKRKARRCAKCNTMEKRLGLGSSGGHGIRNDSNGLSPFKVVAFNIIQSLCVFSYELKLRIVADFIS